MKRFFSIVVILFVISLYSYCQESASPLRDTEIVRKVDMIDIENKSFFDVVVTMKSTSPDYFLTDKYKVKITVTDNNGKKVWKKTLKNVYLYVFSDGQIQIGKQNFNQVVIQRDKDNRYWLGVIREKEGVF